MTCYSRPNTTTTDPGYYYKHV